MLPPVYRTQNYILAPYQLKDFDRYSEMTRDNDVIVFMSGATDDIAEQKKMFEKIFELYRSNDQTRWFWVWAVYRSETLCGHLELKETQDTADDELEVVYMVHPAERRKGIMSEVLNYIKTKQSSWDRRITATVYPENNNSFELLEQVGVHRRKLITDSETGETFSKVWLKAP